VVQRIAEGSPLQRLSQEHGCVWECGSTCSFSFRISQHSIIIAIETSHPSFFICLLSSQTPRTSLHIKQRLGNPYAVFLFRGTDILICFKLLADGFKILADVLQRAQLLLQLVLLTH
jgi:hypothetical protein